MPPKLKRPKNAFTFFLEDYMESQREKGRDISYRIAAEECGPLFQSLPEEQKQNYIDLAACYKVYSKEDKERKFTNTGVSCAQLERQQEERRLAIERADSEIKMTISNLDSELIKTHLFYIIHCNYYCKTEAGLYVPGEMAISEFNLEDGVRRVYHTLINPGPIPLGFALEAKNTIEEVHGLPYPPYEEGDSDYFGILDKVLNFLEPGKLPDGRYPPLYCIENNVKASENILQSLSDNKSEGGDYFRVYLLHKMFFWLKNKCVENVDEENVGFPVMYNAESEISRDLFCYTPGISCPFHITSEGKYQNCSLSVVQRHVYTICDHCCQYVDVKLEPGKHCRVNADVDRKESKSRLERKPKNTSSPSRSEFDFDGRSSYAEDFSCFDWKKEQGCSFLHDEIESKFSAIDMSSVASVPVRPLSTPGFSGVGIRSQMAGEEDEDMEFEDFKTMMSLGRGSNRGEGRGSNRL